MSTIIGICKTRGAAQRYALLFGLLGTLFCTSGLANLSVSAITQTPGNDVWPVQLVTYSFTVSSSFSLPPVVRVTITDHNESDITSQFTSPDCSNIDRCENTINQGAPWLANFTWTPPPGGSKITFNFTCVSQTACTPTFRSFITTIAEPPILDLTNDRLNNTQRATAISLNQLCSNTSNETITNQCAHLASLTGAQLSNALSQIAPDEVTAQGSSSVEVTTTQLTNVRARLATLRNGPTNTRFAMKGLMLAMNSDTLPVGLLADNSDFGSSISSLITNSRLGLFMSGRINFGEKDTTSRETGFDFETQGITAGLDYWFNSKLVIGAALGYAATDSDFSANGGNLDSTAHSASFYGSYYLREDAYIDWIATLGKNDFNARRTIIYSGVDTQTAGNTDGNQLGLSSTAAIDFRFGRLLVSPYVRVDYVNAKIKGYRETGGSGLALAIAPQKTKSLSTAIAARISQAYSQHWGVLVPSAHAEWEHEFKDDGRLITANFVEDPTSSFSIQTDSPDRDYFKFGTALSATLPRGKSAYISYATVAGQDTITSSTIELGGRMEF